MFHLLAFIPLMMDAFIHSSTFFHPPGVGSRWQQDKQVKTWFNWRRLWFFTLGLMWTEQVTTTQTFTGEKSTQKSVDSTRTKNSFYSSRKGMTAHLHQCVIQSAFIHLCRSDSYLALPCVLAATLQRCQLTSDIRMHLHVSQAPTCDWISLSRSICK